MTDEWSDEEHEQLRNLGFFFIGTGTGCVASAISLVLYASFPVPWPGEIGIASAGIAGLVVGMLLLRDFPKLAGQVS